MSTALASRLHRGPGSQPMAYGLLGAALAFVALPLYVLLPAFYAARTPLSLAEIGLVLLMARSLDAVIDPLLGRLADRWLDRAWPAPMQAASVAAWVMALGTLLLFSPPAAATHGASLLWLLACLSLSCLGYSALGVLHQAWGIRLGGGVAGQARLVAWREGSALLGVITASVVATTWGMSAALMAAAGLLLLGMAALSQASRPAPDLAARPLSAGSASGWQLPWRVPAFRAWMAVYGLNGLASAVAASLVLFFIRDRLQWPAGEPICLAAYFLAAALSLPLWSRAARQIGMVRSWLAGMVLAIAVFAGVSALGPSDHASFVLVCVLSGVALGADLALPPVMLASVVAQAGHAGRHEGLYAGWSLCAGKFNLALAAGLALPLVQVLGYQPGSRDADALQALAWVYAGLPCLLKLAAGATLWLQRSSLEST